MRKRRSKSAGAECPARHAQIDGPRHQMDVYGTYELPANTWPQRCRTCNFPDIDAVPQPYFLRKGATAAGDFAIAELGNFFVQEMAQTLLESAAPGACKFFPTTDYKSGKLTNWRLAVPQVAVVDDEIWDKDVCCKSCGEPKTVWQTVPREYKSPPTEVFKSRQWVGYYIAEEAKWYWMNVLKRKEPPVAPEGYWTRIRMARGLYFSARLVFLFKALKLKGLPYRSLAEEERNWEPTPEEAAWVQQQMDRFRDGPTAKGAKPTNSPDDGKWLSRYLRRNATERPMCRDKSLRDWERKHEIKLPASYKRFVTRVGRKRFVAVNGEEGNTAWIVGPRQLDCESYRAYEWDEMEELPDGLLFAVTIGGDCLVFDLRENAPDYPVYYRRHETGECEFYAANFAAALRRLAEGG